MRTCALIVALATTFIAGCGDSPSSNSKCGDGVIAGSEECDDGNMVDGDGCNSDCKFTCLSSDTARNCAAADACAGQGICSDAHVCVTGKPLAEGQDCGAVVGNVCSEGVCRPRACGNGVRDPGEECDDGNKLNLDGCDSACKLEQAARITSLQQQFGVDDFCAKNAIGGAFEEFAQGIIQVTWDQPVADGRLSVVFKFLGSLDPFGASSTFKLGFVNAVPVRSHPDPDNPGTFSDGYSGVSDVDWWYARTPASVDAMETPLIQLPGQVTNRHLTAGPGTLTGLNILFALEPTTVTLFHSKVDATIDLGVSHPLASTAGAAPGHLASEHVSPDIFEFLTSTTGSLCSDVSAASLAGTHLGPPLLGGCTSDPDAQVPEFTSANHLLDVFIAGCDLFGSLGINQTQPDGSLNGAIYEFQFDPATRAVTGCTKDGQPADLTNDCLPNATYSSYFKFSSDRVVIKRDPQPPY